MCGIASALRRPGTGSTETVLPIVMRMLSLLAHRGQEGHGFAGFNPPHDTFDVVTSGDPVSILPFLSAADMKARYDGCHGQVVIAQARYATTGGLQQENLQPMRNDSGNRLPPARRKLIGYNGNLANDRALRDELKDEGIVFRGDTDTEVLLRLLARADQRRHSHSNDRADYPHIFRDVNGRIDGAASVIMADGLGDMVLFRNSLGIRPLYYMETDTGLLLSASETVAFQGHKGTIRSVPPGHVVVYNYATDSLTTSCISAPDYGASAGEVAARENLDVFEPLYFASAASVINGQSNNLTRRQLGQQTAELIAPLLRGMNEEQRSAVRLVPVPNTGIPYAYGAHQILSEAGLVRPIANTQAIGKKAKTRSFISTPEQREMLFSSNFEFMAEDIKGSILFLFEDTLVRGDTSRRLTQRLRALGAREVHWVICSPPIIGSDYYGISIPSLKELAFWQIWKEATVSERARLYPAGERPAEDMDLGLLGKKMAAFVGADSVTYLPLQRLQATLPGGPSLYNYSSLTGHYPSPAAQRRFSRARAKLMAG